MATPISIEIKKSSNTCYFVGETSNVKVRSINVTYDDGTVKTLTSGYTVSQVDTSEAGEKISIVEYSGLTVELAVTVVDSYNVQAGTPNLEDVNITFDLETGLLKVTGTGEFLSLSNIENTPNSIKTRIKKVNIGNGITKIPVDAFGENKNLEDISFPNTLEEICDGNFYSTKITQIVFPQSLKKIGQSCFSSSALISLEIPDSVLEIGSSSFSNLSSLKKVIFHEGLETISPVAFNECPLITELSLPSTLKNMQYSFQGSTLEHLEIGGDGALFATSGSTYINNISAKNTVIRGGTIDNGAFYNNSTIENLALSGSVKLNGVRQFYSCPKLSSVSLENGITRIPAYCFSSCSKITEITIPASVTSIEESAFSDTSLKNLEIANGVKFIWKLAFSNTQLANVLIPASVIKIDKNAFSTKVTTNIALNKKTNEISGSPWGATGTITWLILATRIEVSHMPTKTRYFVGEPFDTTGLVITVYYADNTSTQATGYTLSSPDMSVYGNKTVTVTFDEKTVDFSILVVDISGIEVKTMPVKTEYPKGDVFDTTGLSILVKYTDGTSETITTGFEVSGFDSSSVGEKTITVTCKTHATTFKVIVYDLSGIRITSFPSKVYYKIGEAFAPSGLTVAEVRQDGTEKEITDYDISGFDSSTAGSKTITVSYNATVNGTSKFVGSDSFQIKVTNDGKNPFDSNTGRRHRRN